MRTPLIAGNWKMYKTLAEARELVAGIRDGLQTCFGSGGREVEVLICPPYPLLFPMAKAVAGSTIKLGGQNVHEEPEGAFTGEVSAPMLKDAGCSHVIVGHSERRQHFGEAHDRLARKVRAVTAAGLTVIYCVGETLAERDAGQTQTLVDAQLNAVLGRDVPADRLVIAYEPVWAIGTGRTATPQQAQEVHAAIRTRLGDLFGKESAAEIRVQYGGSVKPSNATALCAQPDIDGALVGGASLVAGDFLAILKAAAAPRAA